MVLNLNAGLYTKKENSFLFLEGDFNLEFGRKYLLPLVPYTFVAIDSGEGLISEKKGRVEYPVESEDKARVCLNNICEKLKKDRFDFNLKIDF
jgi:hypothetical protein